ncbi:lycopene cyclase [Rhodocytophaga rosea]|uniref:Lycopene cyclase n=1 Tax=Rhodocytophaga rosea TaxID=2704465 RepID=A0A6C0GJP8_9BACT|nr:lycopene cyclase family protein [Rhodocytophaga rosea]QHT68301.1 lycopene cyclase [Rhodocytophaga rosea]
MEKFDFIIAGAGCAGLSLAYHLSQSPLQHKSILLIDKAPKTQNDRTWCFWENKPNPFEDLVYRQWPVVDFYGTDFHATLPLEPYQYKMIRGIDFYQYVQQHLQPYTTIKFVYGNILAIYDESKGAAVNVDGKIYEADFVFSSLYNWQNQPKKAGNHYLLQHFKGWEVQTETDFFDPAKATLMDFRIEQEKETRFFYVLPLDKRRALIEFTVFSGNLLPADIYTAQLQAYVKEYLHLPAYRVVHEEFGVIPMTDHQFPRTTGKHIIHIGTAGGQTKASTGYTFLRIQQQTQAIVESLVKTGEPYVSSLAPGRYNIYDSLLLNIMVKNRHSVKDIFTVLFKKNKPGTILKFLDERTTFAEDLKIMSTTPYLPFLKALSDVCWHNKRAVFKSLFNVLFFKKINLFVK